MILDFQMKTFKGMFLRKAKYWKLLIDGKEDNLKTDSK